MIRFGVCMVPFGAAAFDHPWLQPKPTVTSWKALRAIGITDVRLQFNVGGGMETNELVSPSPGVWNTALFKAFIEPAFKAGMRINANYCVGTPVPIHQNASFHEESAFRLVKEFGHMIIDYSFGNEPGADAQKYEANLGGDYMRDVYFPRLYLPFAHGIRRAKFNAWIYGCDADSADIQKRFIDLDIKCNEEAVHPYGEVINQDYSTLKAFEANRSGRLPWGITEIDSKENRKLFNFTKSVVNNPRGCTRFYYLFEGSEAEFFKPEPNGRYSSFYSANPAVNDSGNSYIKLFASVNGSGKRQRSVKKG